MPPLFLDILSALGSLAILALILIGTYYASRWYARRMEASGSGRHIRVLDKAPLGRSVWLAVVEVEGRCFLLGVGEKNVEMLSELQDFPIPSRGGETGPEPFGKILKSWMSKGGPAGGGAANKKNDGDAG